MAPHRRLVILGTLLFQLLPASRAMAQLVDMSPFMSLHAGGANGGTDSESLELRGIISTSHGTRYCIYDPGRKVSTWSGINEHGHLFLITSADVSQQTVTVQRNGAIARLILLNGKTAAVGVSLLPSQLPGARSALASPGVSPAEEAARLAAVTEAVRTRRQIRDQSETASTRAR
jgi:hypothetical protein